MTQVYNELGQNTNANKLFLQHNLLNVSTKLV